MIAPKRFFILFIAALLSAAACQASDAADAPAPPPPSRAAYTVGVEDILDVNVLQPDPFGAPLTVSPDGTITFPYIGNVEVLGKSLIEIQTDIQEKLGAYMKYPVVSVSLKESRSRVFYLYGEVESPGSYPVQPNLTVVRAISLAGGFTKFGSTSRVKILRRGKNGVPGQTLKINIKAAMDGDTSQDVEIEPGDVITVSERIF